MLYYIIFLLLTAIALLERVEVPRETKKWIYITITLIFIALGSLRWETGNDWRPYENFYTTFDSDDPFFMIAMEPGFAYFVRFLRFFSENFTFYLFVLSTLVISMKAVFFYRYTKAILLVTLLYWGTAMGDITAVRQMLAISICLISTIFVIEKRPWPFLFLVFLAAQIHITAYVFVLAYFLYHYDWSIKSKTIWLVVAIGLGMVGGSENLLQIGINLVPGGLGLDRISEKAEIYMALGNEKTYGTNLSKTQRMIAAVAKRAVLLPIFFYFQNKLSNVSAHYKGFLNLYTFGNIVFFIVIDFLTLQRLVSYFYIFEILLFCILYEHVKSRTIWLLIIILYSLSKLVSLVVNGSDLLVPYIWILQSDTNRYVN